MSNNDITNTGKSK